MNLITNWIEIIRTANLSPERKMDVVSKWLLISRACVFSMTILSALIGIILAALDGYRDLLTSLLVLTGLILAHASNNMVNDYFDVRHGVDTKDYPRTKYAPHPILSNLTSVKTLFLAIVICNVIELAIAIWLTYLKGYPIMIFAVSGLALSVLYVAPPLKLKHNGLGEVAIFGIWGPLMIGGTYYALAGTLSTSVIFASVPYGLAVMAVVMGKHLDKREKDEERRVHTLPVILGDRKGRLMMGALIILFYLFVGALVIAGSLPIFSLVTFLTLPRGIKACMILNSPMPETPEIAFQLAEKQIPKDLREKFAPSQSREFPLWPLWYVVWGVWWVRQAGLFLVFGMILGLFW